jgi:hypothetical protein
MNTGEWMPMKKPPIPSASAKKPDFIDEWRRNRAKLDWTESPEHLAIIKEAKRLLPVGQERENQLIREAEHAAELRFLKRKAALLARIHQSDPTV